MNPELRKGLIDAATAPLLFGSRPWLGGSPSGPLAAPVADEVLRAATRDLAWFEPDAAADDILVVVAARAAVMALRWPLVDLVRIVEAFFVRAESLEERVKAWKKEGREPVVPEDLTARSIGIAALLSGIATFEGLDSPEAVEAFATSMPTSDIAAAPYDLRDVLRAAMDRSSDEAAFAAFSAMAAYGRCEFPRVEAEPPVVHHPQFGLGLVTHASASYEDDVRLEVSFEEGPVVLEGREAFWRDPREEFAMVAAHVIDSIGAPVDDAYFWSVIAALGWGTRSTDASALGARLVALTTLEERVTLHGMFYDKRSALQECIEAWEARTGERLSLGDDGFGDLAGHVVGLGRAEFDATMADPRRALLRAERHDYVESFAYVFLYAQKATPRAAIESALVTVRASSSPDAANIVVDARYGAGIVHNGKTLFYDRAI